MRPLYLLFPLLFSLTGCGDPLTQAINAHWPPISVDQQRQTAVGTTAQVLTALPEPNLAMAVKLSDIQTVLFSERLRKEGVTALKIEGDKQLVRLQIDFSRVFTQADAGDDSQAQQALATLRPEISGIVAAYVGVTAAVVTARSALPVLELRFLPALSTLKIHKVKFAATVDATIVAAAIVPLLNKYKDNITGELARAPFSMVTIPALASKPFDLSQNFRD